MRESRVVITIVFFLILVFGGLFYVLKEKPLFNDYFFSKEKEELHLHIDSLERNERILESELIKVNTKTDSIQKLLYLKDKKIILIKKQDHEKSDSINNFGVHALYDFFSKFETR